MLSEKIKRFRLAVLTPRADDATSLVRAMGPLAAMEREDHRLELRFPVVGPEGKELTWDWLLPCDAVFLQRPWLPVHAQVIVQAKMMGLPVWVDWDDDYLSIHPSNPSARHFQYEGMRQNMERITRLADAITVTTGELKERRAVDLPENQRDKIRVVPNACQWPLREPNGAARRVTWRGGQSHEVDLCSVLEQMVELAKDPQFAKWEWCFLGEVPWQAKLKMPPQRLLSDFGAEPWLYMESMNRLEPWVHIVPLEFNRFNLCKSNLAWLEASAAAAIVVAPDMPEWRRPGVLLYRDAESFKRVLKGALEMYADPSAGHALVKQSQKFIQELLTLETLNKIRWTILNQLYEKSKTV